MFKFTLVLGVKKKLPQGIKLLPADWYSAIVTVNSHNLGINLKFKESLGASHTSAFFLLSVVSRRCLSFSLRHL